MGDDMKKFIYFLSIIFVVLLGMLILTKPQLCVHSALKGIVLCGKIIIPTLYPFTFCVLFIINSGMLNKLKFADKITHKIFGMPFSLFTVFILSLIGGYPLGAKLISSTGINKSTAKTMLMFCVNAGPAFIITAVGVGVFGSARIGVLLFICHIIPSFVLALLSKKKLQFSKVNLKKPLNITDNFVISASSAAEALITICSFVILYSIICAYINTLPFLKQAGVLLEVTNGINMTQNILVIAFLLGFGGICIWCQIMAICRSFKPNILKFALYRIFHGLLSAVLTYFALKILKIALPALSNQKPFNYGIFTNGAAVGISLIIMALVLIISLKNKNYTGKMLDDIV